MPLTAKKFGRLEASVSHWKKSKKKKKKNWVGQEDCCGEKDSLNSRKNLLEK